MVDSAAPVSAKVVGTSFVGQYYHMLHKKPELVYRFYKNVSRVTRPEEDGTMSTTTTEEAIKAKILSFNYGDSTIDLKHVDAQETCCGGVLVLLTGYIIGEDNFTKSFSQSFFLAPHDKGYFVLNDIFRYTQSASYRENANHQEEKFAPTQGVVAPVTPGQAHEIVPVVEKNIPEDAAVLTEESRVKEGVHVVKEEVTPVQEVAPVSDVVYVVQLVVESNTKAEDHPKKSYTHLL